MRGEASAASMAKRAAGLCLVSGGMLLAMTIGKTAHALPISKLVMPGPLIQGSLLPRMLSRPSGSLGAGAAGYACLRDVACGCRSSRMDATAFAGAESLGAEVLGRTFRDHSQGCAVWLL